MLAIIALVQMAASAEAQGFISDITISSTVPGNGDVNPYEHYRERLADLKERLASQDRLLTEYRAKLSGANPEEAATQIEQLTAALACCGQTPQRGEE